MSTPYVEVMDQWSYLYSPLPLKASLKTTPEDFLVTELLGFEPSGEGEHLFLLVEKVGLTTDEVSRILAKWLGVAMKVVSYSGLKDKQARTQQWFSIHLPGKDLPELQNFENDAVRVLKVNRHTKKLQRGAHLANGFSIQLRDLEGDTEGVAERIEAIARSGVPNYFGPQRFGHDGYNLHMADRLFQGELTRLSNYKRGLFISAARSYLFNNVVSQRIKQGFWERVLNGDIVQNLETGKEFLVSPDNLADTQSDRELNKVSATAPMPGAGLRVREESASFEESVLSPSSEWIQSLGREGLKHDRRALVLPVSHFTYEFNEAGLRLNFTLPSGSYATSVIREICSIHSWRGSDLSDNVV
ncbi:tRNA pseudouridine(13) synthase TruD [Pokkaliibacter sp. CJK22405]|uniref:tRNA pseudouridine(13) synthase TruD n=1 Tax=Pokkaliibacter sp. CJK22405 TaxID=3384615 RepID=UPI003984FBD7